MHIPRAGGNSNRAHDSIWNPPPRSCLFVLSAWLLPVSVLHGPTWLAHSAHQKTWQKPRRPQRTKPDPLLYDPAFSSFFGHMSFFDASWSPVCAWPGAVGWHWPHKSKALQDHRTLGDPLYPDPACLTSSHTCFSWVSLFASVCLDRQEMKGRGIDMGSGRAAWNRRLTKPFLISKPQPKTYP